MSCFRKSSGIYVLNNTKKCKPATDIEIEIQDVQDDVPVPSTNGKITEEQEPEEQEPKERRAGIQAPVIKIDENTNSVKKYPKSSE